MSPKSRSRPSGQGAGRNLKSPIKQPPTRWWRRPFPWVATVISAFVLATAGAFGSGLGQHFVSLLTTRNAKSTYSPPEQPVQVESAIYQFSPGAVFAFPGALTANQVTHLTQGPGIYSDGVPIQLDKYMTKVTDEGGAPVGTYILQVVLRNKSDQTVVVTGLETIKQCGPSLAGTLLYSPDQGSMPDVRLGFDLDQPVPYAQFGGGDTYVFSGNFFANDTINMNSGEVDTLSIGVNSYNYYCRYTFRLMIDNGARQVVEAISNHGQPFVITGSPKPRDKQAPFSAYKEVFAGGTAIPNSNGPYLQVNPMTFNGSIGLCAVQGNSTICT